jgi:pyrroline-5-carboxylate reductase
VNEGSSAPATIALVGAGKMGVALLRGWAAYGFSGQNVAVFDPQPSAQLIELCEVHGFRLGPAPAEAEAPEALVLAIKPQVLDSVAPSLGNLIGPDTLILSILAGKRISDISARAPAARAIVRAMPNTPAAIGRGVTGAFANSCVSPRQREAAHALLGAVGSVEWVEREELIDTVTAVSGSGPAYVFYFVEALAKAGAAAGLPADLAARLARATVEGAGELLHRSPEVTPETLRHNVTSPGGTTAAALDVLMAKDGLEPLFQRAVDAAERRARELSG